MCVKLIFIGHPVLCLLDISPQERGDNIRPHQLCLHISIGSPGLLEGGREHSEVSLSSEQCEVMLR